MDCIMGLALIAAFIMWLIYKVAGLGLPWPEDDEDSV
jgi:hypothetical protein